MNAERGSFPGEGSLQWICANAAAVHLTLGFLTVRLDREAFRELARAVDGSARELWSA